MHSMIAHGGRLVVQDVIENVVSNGEVVLEGNWWTAHEKVFQALIDNP